MRERDYPYTGIDRGPCKFDKSKIAASVANFSVVSLDEEQICSNLVKNAPCSCYPCSFYVTYIAGFLCLCICGKHLNHGVAMVLLLILPFRKSLTGS
ncbi:cysteine protease [Vigna angularis]|uniref:Cysteine protease n=1 Tax=Phaseolus angularis TaxID=3914 RepID=A0A8T0LH66_PHAAN|nr:cysteine protease [Vigna angularis]